MKKRMLVVAMAGLMCGSALFTAGSFAKTEVKKPYEYTSGEEEDDYYWGCEGDDGGDDGGCIWSGEEEYVDPDDIDDIEIVGAPQLTPEDVVVTPAKKTLRVGKSFSIELYPSEDMYEEYGDLPDEEWEELIDEAIDKVSYRSTKSSVASVTGKGKVKCRRKGTAVIKTTISFSDGSEKICKTKVYVR